MKIERKETLVKWPVEWQWFGAAEGPITLFLHGYMQTAEKISRLLSPSLPKAQRGLAICAPFPVMRRRDEDFELAYTWFFYNPKTQEYSVRREFAQEFIISTLRDEGLLMHVQRVVGYSQGGYLAPFIANELPKVGQVLGINCRFRHEDLIENARADFRWDQVNGLKDQVVDPENARASHEIMIQAGGKGEFIGLENTGHEINAEVVQQVRRFLQVTLP